MRSTFATFGIPETLVTDNGTNFTSAEFEVFEVKWNTPYPNSSIPPSLKWPRRTGCANIQIWNEETH